jgi:hypothetical protein
MKGRIKVASALVALGAMSSSAQADSCWNHNGSLMRLVADGDQRWFYYEDPKAGLSKLGIEPGTLLFDGRKSGSRYRGTARVFSASCPDDPLPYPVSGPVSSNQRKVTLRGEREVYEDCEATGRFTTDTLVFTYVSDC